MIPRPPSPTRTDPLVPHTALVRSEGASEVSQACQRGRRASRHGLFGFLGVLRFKDLENERYGLVDRERHFRVVIDKDVRFARDGLADRKSTRLNSSHYCATRMPSSA